MSITLKQFGAKRVFHIEETPCWESAKDVLDVRKKPHKMLVVDNVDLWKTYRTKHLELTDGYLDLPVCRQCIHCLTRPVMAEEYRLRHPKQYKRKNRQA